VRQDVVVVHTPHCRCDLGWRSRPMYLAVFFTMMLCAAWNCRGCGCSLYFANQDTRDPPLYTSQLPPTCKHGRQQV